MDWILPLIAGLGLGSILKSIADHFMNRRASNQDRWYGEKRETYLGLISALHDAAVNPSDANSKAFALWQTRCNLFGSEDVSKFVEQIVTTNDGPPEKRNIAFQGMVRAMKRDIEQGA